MEALEKAKLALRKHLLENKERVAADLDAMRRKSEGRDIFNYIENASMAFSFESIACSSIEISYNYSFPEIDCYNLLNELIETSSFSPPNDMVNKTKKALVFYQGFFFNIIAAC